MDANERESRQGAFSNPEVSLKSKFDSNAG
jgi:hypothetical protein